MRKLISPGFSSDQNSTWDVTGEGPPCTDVGNAQRFARDHAHNLKYVIEWKKWIIFEEEPGHWTVDNSGKVVQLAKQTVLSIHNEAKASANKFAELTSHALRSQSATRLKAMIELAQAEPGMQIKASQLDQDDYIMGVANGVVDLKTGLLRAGHREDYITQYTSVPYHPEAECPLFLSCIERSFAGNRNLIEFFHRSCGYFLTGDTGAQAMFLLSGEGANGKSTLMNALKEVCGDYACQTPADTLIVKKGSQIRNDLARLQHSRLVVTSEMERGEQFAEAVIKQMTGEDTIASRFLYREFFEYRPKYKICVPLNHKPIIRGRDIAIWRRIHTIPFTVVIPPAERDPNLPRKLRAEYPGILAWAVRGSLEYQRQGLNPPSEVMLATQQYQSEMDPITRFIEECCIMGEAFSVNATQLYQVYVGWCRQNQAKLLSQTKFGEEMTGRGFSKEKSGTYTYLGIGVVDHS